MSGRIRVLAVCAAEADAAALRGFARHGEWNLTVVPGEEDGVAVLARREIDVVLCDRPVFGTLRGSSPRSAFVITSDVTDDRLWIETIESGGFDVVTRPFHEGRVVEAVRLAFREGHAN